MKSSIKKLIITLIIALSTGSLHANNLDKLIQTAMERNLKLKISDIEIEQSFIDQKNALNALIPDINLSASRSHKTFKDSYQKSNPFSFDSTLTYSLKLTQSYPGLGRIPLIQKEIAKLKTKIKETAKQNAKIQVLRQLARVYFQLVKEQELTKVHKTDLFLISELMKVAKLNEEVGLVLKNDVLRIEVEQLNAKSDLVKSENSFKDLQYDLASILDYDSITKLQLELPMGLKFPPGSFTCEALLPVLYKNDNDIKLAELDAQILKKAEKAARSAYLPTLTFDGSYNHGRKLGPIEGTKDISATFILTTPVYDGNQIENSIRLAQKSREIAELRIADLKNSKKATLEKAIADYTEALARISFAEKAVEQSYENMRIVYTRYKEGASSIVELVDAQRVLTNSAQTAIKTYYDERERLVEILLLIHDFDRLGKTDNEPSALNFDFLLKQLNLKIGD
ncbi:MAG: efflux transporter outer membrane subunit [Candidatus Rifleibacteriota bacterium]